MMKKRPTLRIFLLLSILIHLLAVTTHMLYPKVPPPVEKKEPIKVKFQAPKKPEIPAFIETSKPKKIEPPKTSDFVSKYNNTARSPAKIHNASKPKSRKTIIPKLVPRKPTPIPVPSQKPKLTKKPKKVIKKTPKPPKKEAKKKAPKALKKKIETKKEKKNLEPKPKLKITDKFIEPTFQPHQQTRQQIKSPELPQSQSLLAMIDGIDPEKYASIEIDEKEDAADEEEVSLNTTEIKYADYMARIKHQIEKVWTYPEQAARKGISGEITLRFKLSKDGNLMSVRMLDSSGTKILDTAAIKAVKGAAPYYPFPATITTKKLVITASFIYSPSYGNPYAYR